MVSKSRTTVAKESPETVHGRLLEAVHLSGYSFERACSELEWLLDEDRWKKCGFDDIKQFLETVDLSPFRIDADHRKRLAKKLADLQASQRATAKALGVDHSTINEDLRGGNPPKDKSNGTENKSDSGSGGGNPPPTSGLSGVEAARALEKKSHVSKNSGENEWYTPPQIIEAARKAMGAIDLDPASSKLANKTVKAKRFYSAEQDGLAKEWKGAVWLNPPYSQPLAADFCKKAVEHAATSKHPTCVLTNNATETEWGQLLIANASSVCFLEGRLKYLDKTGKPANTPLQGQCVSYFGRSPAKFRDAFKSLGTVLKPW